MNSIFNKKPFLSIALFYFFGNFTLLINNGIYWDDWTIFGSSFKTLMIQFNGNGIPFFGYLHSFLLQSKYAIINYHALTFILQLSTGYVLWRIFKLLKVSHTFSYWIVLLFTITPYYAAKNTLICFPYTVTNFLFFLASLWMLIAIKNKSIIYRIMSLFLFLLSFLTNSFVVFYIVPYLILYISSNEILINKISFKEIKNQIKLKELFKTIDFLSLPFVFFIIKLIFFQTSGLYAETKYNELKFSSILKIPNYLIKTIQESFFGLFSNSFSVIYNNIGFMYLIIILFFIVKYFFKRINFNKNNSQNSKPNRFIIIGFILFLLATLPYGLVGKIPSFQGYETRHQLLLPIGISLFIVGLTYKIFKKDYFNNIMFSITTLFIIFTLSQNFQYLKGWLKQESFYMNIKTNKKIKDNNSFIVLDYTKELNATSRDLAFYNLNGIAKKAFGTQTRFLCEHDEYILRFNQWEMLFEEAEKFNLKDYKLSEPNYVIKINKGEYNLNNLNTLKLLLYKILDQDKYSKKLNDILTIKVGNYDAKTSNFFLKK